MDSKNNIEGKGIKVWIEYRLPIFSFIDGLVGRKFYVPKNLSYAWNFGVLAALGLGIQIITGIFLAMHYTPHVDYAFDSVEYIMRDVQYGWLIRYCHAVGASFFFIVVYIHILRGLYYGSYKKPRELLWFVGVLIFLIMMATAFMGYVLPWGQMSFWGVTVITNLFSAIPFIGDKVVIWLWGGYSVDNPTLNRFFALHYLLPFIIVAFSMLHIAALHRFGSGNPTGVEVKSRKDTIPFHPYYTIKDLVGVGLFFIIFAIFLFYIPNYLGHPDNYIPADPMVTPAHIVPEWYFLPFYAMLRSVPSKIFGVITMLLAVLILLFLPWLDSSQVKSGKYRPLFKIVFWIFAFNFVFLGWIGGRAAEEPYVTLGRLGTAFYFSYFMVILPFLSRYEKARELPESISDSVPHMK